MELVSHKIQHLYQQLGSWRPVVVHLKPITKDFSRTRWKALQMAVCLLFLMSSSRGVTITNIRIFIFDLNRGVEYII